MKNRSSLKPVLFFSVLFVFGSLISRAQQCTLFKSEITDVKDYQITVNQLSDSLSAFAETAAFAARYTEGRTNARKVEFLAGKALEAAQEAVNYASEAQYHAEVCGIDAVITNAINAEALSVDTRDFADVAYANARKAGAAGKLGDIHFYMRRSLQAAREARKVSEKAMYAAFDAFHSCTHDDDARVGRN